MHEPVVDDGYTGRVPQKLLTRYSRARKAYRAAYAETVPVCRPPGKF